ncbi:MAG: hemerythrin domain-containing protein [Sinobacterium sp.]|nr:hemerythrin domain-containing protein [Sinobacterium sp.]
MNAVMDSLSEDHLYMVKMTYLLDVEIKALTGLTKKAVQKTKVLDILNYINDYSNYAHHQLEEFLFERVKNYPLDEHEKIELDIIASEHDTLKKRTVSLEEKVCDFMVKQGAVADVLIAADALKRTQLSHIQREQEVIFPILMEKLSGSDWAEAENLAISEHDQWKQLCMRKTLASQNIITQS